jgi:hypothetical protein
MKPDKEEVLIKLLDGEFLRGHIVQFPSEQRPIWVIRSTQHCDRLYHLDTFIYMHIITEHEFEKTTVAREGQIKLVQRCRKCGATKNETL